MLKDLIEALPSWDYVEDQFPRVSTNLRTFSVLRIAIKHVSHHLAAALILIPGVALAQCNATDSRLLAKAKAGDSWAQLSLGECYRDGQGVPQDYVSAVTWFRKSAAQGNRLAEADLARQLLDGQGASQSVQEAIDWFQKAAEQGDPESEYMLGQLYEDGGEGKLVHEPGGSDRLQPPEGEAAIPKNYTLAIFWFRKAAEQGHSIAQSHLGRLYEDGTGVPQDYSQAYFWASIATASGSSSGSDELSRDLANDRDRIASHLTQAELLKVQERTRTWFAAHQSRAQ